MFAKRHRITLLFNANKAYDRQVVEGVGEYLQASQQEWDILQPHLLQVFPVSAVVSLLQVQPAQHLEQSARIPAFLVNP